jgi:hypothetical protein
VGIRNEEETWDSPRPHITLPTVPVIHWVSSSDRGSLALRTEPSPLAWLGIIVFVAIDQYLGNAREDRYLRLVMGGVGAVVVEGSGDTHLNSAQHPSGS